MTKKYESLTILKAIATIGILLLHVRANAGFFSTNEILTPIITSFSDFVFLFMVLSAFGICNGYYETFINNNISIFAFYKKRYRRILPFLLLLVTIDLVLDFNINRLYEGITDVLLINGLLPNNNLSVIGVAWTLGVIYIYYLLFPFFCFLMQNKKTFIIIFIILVAFSYFCSGYFGISSTHFLYNAQYFVSGSIIYLYKDRFNNSLANIIPFIISIVVYIYFGSNSITTLFLSTSLVILFLSYNDVFMKRQFKILKLINSNGLEIYLSHMMFYRILEKFNILYLFNNDYVNFIFDSIVILTLSIIFSIVFNKVLSLIKRSY